MIDRFTSNASGDPNAATPEDRLGKQATRIGAGEQVKAWRSQEATIVMVGVRRFIQDTKQKIEGKPQEQQRKELIKSIVAFIQANNWLAKNSQSIELFLSGVCTAFDIKDTDTQGEVKEAVEAQMSQSESPELEEDELKEPDFQSFESKSEYLNLNADELFLTAVRIERGERESKDLQELVSALQVKGERLINASLRRDFVDLISQYLLSVSKAERFPYNLRQLVMIFAMYETLDTADNNNISRYYIDHKEATENRDHVVHNVIGNIYNENMQDISHIDFKDLLLNKIPVNNQTMLGWLKRALTA